MSEAAQTPAVPTTPAFAMLRTLGLIAMLSGFLVVVVVQITAPMIEENKRIAIQKAVFRVVPGASQRVDFLIDGERLVRADDPKTPGERIYAAYDGAGVLRGVAVEAAAMGYADVIRALYGYDPGCQCIIGYKVLKTAETPGIGDKIDFDPGFLANFEALDAKLDTAGSGLANPIVAVRHGTKRNPWEIDAISGATVSSKAVAKMLNRSAQRIAPILMHDLALLTDRAPKAPAAGAKEQKK